MKNKDANLLIITFDQLRGDWANTKNGKIKLKAMEKIAARGWEGKNCYTTSPQCVPARLSLLSGLFPSQLGVTKNEAFNVPADTPSQLRKIRDKGWHTALIGKTHWTNHTIKDDLRKNRDLMNELGLDYIQEIAGPRALQRIKCDLTEEWEKNNLFQAQMNDLKKRYGEGRTKNLWEARHTILPNNLYPDIWIANQAIKYIQKLPEKKPWLLWISFVGPHEPFDTPQPWEGKNKENKNIQKTYRNVNWIEQLGVKTSLRNTYQGWKGKVSSKEIANLRINYADHCNLLDDQVNRITEELRKRKDHKRTAILITSDHGDMLGDYGMLFKSTFLEPSIKVPMIYRPPDENNLLFRRITKEAISIKDVVKEVINNLPNGGKLGPIKNASETKKPIICEYDNEFALIYKSVKGVYDSKGELLWATKIMKSGQEVPIHNKTEGAYVKDQKTLNNLNKIAKSISKKRARKSWLKKNLSLGIN